MIEREEKDDVRVARIVRGKGNSLDIDLLKALTAELADTTRSEARALVLIGEGKAFCAGVDLVKLAAGGQDYVREFLPALSECFVKLVTFPKPLIAAVNGHAIAGGCLIALASDWQVMARGVGRIGLTELLVGVPFPSIPLEIARGKLTPRAFRQVVLTGKLYSPEEALEMGLVDELADADQVLARALEVAKSMAAVPFEAFSLTKLQMNQPIVETFERHWPMVDPQVFKTWMDPATLGHIQRFVAERVGKSS